MCTEYANGPVDHDLLGASSLSIRLNGIPAKPRGLVRARHTPAPSVELEC